MSVSQYCDIFCSGYWIPIFLEIKVTTNFILVEVHYILTVHCNNYNVIVNCDCVQLRAASCYVKYTINL